MKRFISRPTFTRRVAWTGLVLPILCACFSCYAQGSGRLYDPEPPVDSGYVRVIVAQPGVPVDLAVDGKVRVNKLPALQVSDYLVLGEGSHTITLHPASKDGAPITKTFIMQRGKALTLAFASLRADAAQHVFEDKANTNKLKAILTAYHLDARSGPMDVVTSSSNAKVFTGLSYGTSASIQVNPITVELLSSPTDGKSTGAKFSLQMTQGGTYSIMLLREKDGKMGAKVIQNKTERYVGSVVR